MEKGDALPEMHYDVADETFEKAIAKCPMNCYVRYSTPATVPEEAEAVCHQVLQRTKNDVNTLLLQPIINYNFSKGWYFTSVPVITAESTGTSVTWPKLRA